MPDAEPPSPICWAGIYHPGMAKKFMTDLSLYEKAFLQAGRPTLGLLFYRDEWIWDDLHYQKAFIEEAERQGQKKKAPPARSGGSTVFRSAASSELDIRGMESIEADSAVQTFLSAAAMGHLETVTIIHGKGTGALRKAVHETLKRSKLVKSFRLGVYGEGESGVTVVTLK